MTAAQETVRAVDLFCGAGGLSTGLALACERLERDVELAAVNHWGPAIETHKRNHPWADHYHSTIQGLKPVEVFDPSTTIEILIAAPSCTDHSPANGGAPTQPQDRMAPFHIFDWVAQLQPDVVLVENVPAFRSWGPVVDGERTRNGTFFEAWTRTLEDLGYHLDDDVLCAADYGDPTSRRRLFVVARRDEQPVWPEPTHAELATEDRDKWRPAADVIDFSRRGQSIWTRGLEGNGKKPLAENTHYRIAQGIRRHGDDELTPFADVIESLAPADVERMQTDVVDAAQAHEIVPERDEPVLVKGPVAEPERDGDRPPTWGLCQPTVKGQHGSSVPRDATDAPVQTVTTDGNIQIYDAQAVVLPRNGRARGLDSNPAYDPDEQPLHTVTAKNTDGHLVSPFLVVYNGQSTTSGVDEPLPTQPATDRFALALPELWPWGLDVHYRMLQPDELAAAQGFPDEYDFAGDTKETRTKQIGNAVPVNLATALCEQLLRGGSPTLGDFTGQEMTEDGAESSAD